MKLVIFSKNTMKFLILRVEQEEFTFLHISFNNYKNKLLKILKKILLNTNVLCGNYYVNLLMESLIKLT